MRPGDIITHCFTGHSMNLLDPNGQLYPRIAELREQGLVLDIGHGAGSFSFETARTMLANGILPDVISTDIHQLAIQGPCFDMPTTISKFLAIGMSIEDAIERATSQGRQGDPSRSAWFAEARQRGRHCHVPSRRWRLHLPGCVHERAAGNASCWSTTRPGSMATSWSACRIPICSRGRCWATTSGRR